jgi:hypothetical protein
MNKTVQSIRETSAKAFADFGRQIVTALVILSQVFQPVYIAAESTITGVPSHTNVTKTGDVYSVTPKNTSGINVFNSFSAFNLEKGDIANLYVPGTATNLINISSARFNIDGVLNSIQNGTIGGNVWFASPDGFVVGQSGVINVGSLMVATPSETFIEGFFSGEDADETSLSSLLGGSYPLSADGLISIAGRINAMDAVSLNAGAINVSGSIYTGSTFNGTEPDFSAIVNVEGIEGATNIIAAEAGKIKLKANSDVTISSTKTDQSDASVIIKNALIKGANVTIDAKSTVNVSASSPLPVGASDTKSAASVNVSDSNITSTGDTKLSASSTVASSVDVKTPDINFSADAAVAINKVTSSAAVIVGGTSNIQADGALSLSALNKVTATTNADASAEGSTAAGGTLALSVVNSTTKASIEGKATTSSNSLSIAADSSNTVSTTAKAAAKGAAKQTEEEKDSKASQTESTLGEYKDTTSTSDGSVDAAAAVAIAVVNSSTEASITSTATSPQSSTEAASITTKADTSSTVTSDASATESDTGVGAAVGVNIGILDNTAYLADDSKLEANGLTLSAGMTEGKVNSFTTETTSGAGASGVGVAGSLAVNTVVNTTVAAIEGDKDLSDTGATLNAGEGDILIAAESANSSTVKSGAAEKGVGKDAKVGVGASLGTNVAVNTTVAEIGANAAINGGKDLGLNAKSENTMTTEATGGASGGVAITPLAAVSIAVNTTSAELKNGDKATITGAYSSTADQTSETTTVAKGQTEGGDKVAVGASLGVTIATDTVNAIIDRDLSATGGVSVAAKSVARSDTSATASVSGGKEAESDGSAKSGESVDEQVAAKSDAGKKQGAAATAKADAKTSAASGTSSSDKLKTAEAAPTTKDKDETGKDSGGGVSVAAAVGINVGVSTTSASIGKERTVESGGAVSVTSSAQTDAKAKADGTQAGSDNTKVGVGAAVALNVGVGTNTAVIGDDATVTSKGATVKADMASTSATKDGETTTDATNDSGAEATSGAGATSVGIAGSLAVNTVVNTTVAAIEGNKDGDAKTATLNAGTGEDAGDVLIAAESANSSTVKSGAAEKGVGKDAKVGVGASLGTNVAVNTTVAEIGTDAAIIGGKDLGLNAKSENTMSTEATGGASGGVAITPLAAVSIAVNTTSAELKNGDKSTITGTYSSTADQTSETTTVAKGQTEGGDKVAVGASLGVTIATDTVNASIDRDLSAADGVSVAAKSVARSDTSATASGSGGKEAEGDGSAKSGESVDEQVAAKSDAGKKQGAAATAKADAKTSAASGTSSSDKLKTAEAAPTTKDKDETGKDSGGGVSVAAAVGINVGTSTTSASIGKERTVESGGAVSVTSSAQTDAKAKADGTQAGSDNTKVGVGAAVALNVGVGTNTAVIGDDATVTSKGATVKADMASTSSTKDGETTTDATNDSGAEATSGAGAASVGIAGSLAVNTVVNTTVAAIESNKDGDAKTATLNAGAGDVQIAAESENSSAVKSGADVKGSGKDAKVGVGASIGTNVIVNTTSAEVGANSSLAGGKDLSLVAKSGNATTTDVTGGAAGAKVSITPVAAVSVVVNTTSATVGDSVTALNPTGNISAKTEQTDTVTTKAKGQAQGDVAVGAALAAAVIVDSAKTDIARDITTSSGIELSASSKSTATTTAEAGAKGAKAAEKDKDGKETPAEGTTVDEQKKTQVDNAKRKNAKTAALDTDAKTVEAKTPEVNKDSTTEVGTNKPSGTDKESGKKVSVAAAIGVDITVNQATATIGGENVKINTAGDLTLAASTDTNYATKATGEAVSDDVGVAAAVALTGTFNKTEAGVAAETEELKARNIKIDAVAKQNQDGDYLAKNMGAKAISGASGGEVAVAGALALVVNENTTSAYIGDDSTVTATGDVAVNADETSKVAAAAIAGALSKGGDGKESKAGVGASFAVIVSGNDTKATVGSGSTIDANSLSVTADKNKVAPSGVGASITAAIPKSVDEAKNFDFEKLDPSNYIGTNNYYTEAIAGSASKGNVAVSGAFSVNVFTNETEASIGDGATVNTKGNKDGTAENKLGVDVAASADTQTLAITGAVAGAKKAGIGISNTDIVNSDSTKASVGVGSSITASGSTTDANGIKVSADAAQSTTSISVSAAGATGNVGVAGVLSVDVSVNEVGATIAKDAKVKSSGDLRVAASNDSSMTTIAGGVAGGKDAGVGGSVAINGLWNSTKASIADSATVDAKKTVSVEADADETMVNAVVAGSGGGKVGVAAALSLNIISADTEATIGKGAKVNTTEGYEGAEKVELSASDDTKVVSVTGGASGGGKAGIGAAADTTVAVKKVKATVGESAVVNAAKSVGIDASSSEQVISVTAGLGFGGNAGVGGAVSIGVVANEVEASTGKSSTIDSDGNVIINAQDDTSAVLVAGSAAGGGDAGIGGSIAVATLTGSTKALVGDSATVNARGASDAETVYSGETVLTDTDSKPGDSLAAKKTEEAKGLSVTAYNREILITTAASGAGGGTAGVAATVSANVIATKSEASIGQRAKINEDNELAGTEQEVRVKAIDETLLIDTAAGAAGGGTAGVGAGGNVGVIAKTTTAKIGKSTTVNAAKGVELDATSSQASLGITAGFAGGGSAGVGGAVVAIGVDNTTEAYIEDGTSKDDAAHVNVTGGDLSVEADSFSSSFLITGSGAGGGAAGVGASIAVAVNTSETKAEIGDYAETNASGATKVEADSTENVNTITVAGAGGGSAGVAGALSVNVVSSKTEASIGSNAKVNQDTEIPSDEQSVGVKASDTIITVDLDGAGAGGGAAGVGATVDVAVIRNTTMASIGAGAEVDAKKDIAVDASSDKYVNSAVVAGAGGGAAGVAGAVSILSVGSLLDGEAKSGLGKGSTSSAADAQTSKSAVKDKDTGKSALGDSAQSQATTKNLDDATKGLAVGSAIEADAVDAVPLANATASIEAGAIVKAGGDIGVTARDKTQAIVVAGAGAGGGAAGVAGSLGVVLLHDSATARIADNATVDAGKKLAVAAKTEEIVANLGITGSGAGAADVGASLAVNVIDSDTTAYIGAANVNQDDAAGSEQSVAVTSDSDSTIASVAASGGGAGAASVGGVVNVNTLNKKTKAAIKEGAKVNADTDVAVKADSDENIVGAGLSIRGAGAAAVSGVLSANVIDNTTEAYIGSAKDDLTKAAATVDSDGNVAVQATDDALIVAVSAIGNGAGAAAVGIDLGANVISSETSSYIGDNSVVDARGNAAGGAVYDGTLSNTTETLSSISDKKGKPIGAVDANKDGKADGDASSGTFTVAAEGSDAKSSIDPTKKSDGSSIAGASGGSKVKNTETVKGLSVVAMNDEKVVSATIGIAGAGAAAVTGSAVANVISSTTESSIGDGAKINTGAGTTGDNSVRVIAADNTLMVQTAGTIAGAGAAAVSGSNNTGVVTKTTSSRIGKATVNGSDIEASAASSENIYNITANVSVGGAAGVGAAVGVDVIANTTSASIDSGAVIDATGDLSVAADQDTQADLYTVAGAGGIVGVSGAVSVAVVENETSAAIEGAESPAQAANINAGGATTVAATSSEDLGSITASAAGGGVGVAGSVGVKVAKSTTTASIGKNVQVNQSRGASSGKAQDVTVTASDSVKLSGGGGSLALGAYAGGAMADVNIVRNTTTASIGDSAKVHADGDVKVSADSSKDASSTAIAAAGGLSLGISGAVSVAVIGAKLDGTSQDNLGDKGGETASYADGKIKQNKFAEDKQGTLGKLEHGDGANATIAGKISGASVASDMNSASTDSLDKTQASIGANATIDAGSDIEVSASEKIKVDIDATGAALGLAGIGGAVGVAVANSTTEAFAGPSSTLSAGGNISVEAASGNIGSSGSTVTADAGAGGLVGVGAAIAVMDDTSATKAYLGSGAKVTKAGTVKVDASTARTASADTVGAAAGAVAVGVSLAKADFSGSTQAYGGSGLLVGQEAGSTVGDLLITASDDSVAVASAKAGAGGIVAGSGADATASVRSTTIAKLGDDAKVKASGTVGVSATTTPSAKASALGVNVGAGAVGASLATATSGAQVSASLGNNDTVEANNIEVIASRKVGTAPTAQADALGAAGGILLGANATVATATSTGATEATVGEDSSLRYTDNATVSATDSSLQISAGRGFVNGLVSVGADLSLASSDTTTLAAIGDGVAITSGVKKEITKGVFIYEGGSLNLIAESSDANYAYGIAGSGGLLSAPFSQVSTLNKSRTFAKTGSGSKAGGMIDVGSLLVKASHYADFNSWIDNTNASLIGVSGAKALNRVYSDTEASIGASGYIEADNITMKASNDIEKGNSDVPIPTLKNQPAWNGDSISGGLADAPAVESSTVIEEKALVQVGDKAHLEQSGDRKNPGAFNLDASNKVVASDKVKMSSGGAVSVARAESSIVADVNEATVSVGEGATMSSLGDMKLGARSVADLSTQSAVDVYGLVGVAPRGSSVSRFNALNSIDIGAKALLESKRSILLAAGANTDGEANDISAVAHTDIYNNTAIPVEIPPVADAAITTNSKISVGTDSDLAAVKDIYLYAEEGKAKASGVGIGKDIYREALAAIASAISNAFGGGDVSFETRTGSSSVKTDSEVDVDGRVRVGTQRNQSLVLNFDGSISATEGITYSTAENVAIAEDILKRIAELRDLIKLYSGSSSTQDAYIAVKAYESEISFLEGKLKEMGIMQVVEVDEETNLPVIDPETGKPKVKENPAYETSSISPRDAAIATLGNSERGFIKTLADYTASLKVPTDRIADTATRTGQNTSLKEANVDLEKYISDNETTVTAAKKENEEKLIEIGENTEERDKITDPTDKEWIRLNELIIADQEIVDANLAKINPYDEKYGTLQGNISTIAANDTQIGINNLTLEEDTAEITRLKPLVESLAATIADIEYRLTLDPLVDEKGYSTKPFSGPVATYVTVDDAVAQLGNIDVHGDNLQGKGSLDAPGDASISIENHSPSFLVLNDLTIPSNEGGKVYFNGVEVNSNSQIDEVNETAGVADLAIRTAETAIEPTIKITSTYDPFNDLRAVASGQRLSPDIIMKGDVSNLRGSFVVESASGSVRVEQSASINAKTVQIGASNGDFVQSYSDTKAFNNIAGAPLEVKLNEDGKTKYIDETPEVEGKGIFANGNVLIAARYLNINGTIQSGMPEWGVTIPAEFTVTVDGVEGKALADAIAYYTKLTDVEKAKEGAELFKVGGTTLNGVGKYEQRIDVFYNAKENRLELGGVKVKGGYIELCGQIYNTNQDSGGKLKVLDGYGQIKVDNKSSLTLWLNNLDTGDNAHGKISITDIDVKNNTPRTTVFEKGMNGYVYNPASGLRYALTIGTDYSTEAFYRYSSTSFLGAITLSSDMEKYRIATYPPKDSPLDEGEFLGAISLEGDEKATDPYITHTQEWNSIDPVIVMGRSWRETYWWSLWTTSTVYQEFTVTTGKKIVTTKGVRADYPIGIEYIGYGTGAIDVTSVGNVVLGGSLTNRDGNTKVTSDGSIVQASDTQIVSGNNIALTGVTGIGSATQSVQVEVGDGYKLDATSTSGDINVAQVLGDLKVGTISGAGTVKVEAEDDIVGGVGSYVQGKRVELVSQNGAIGALIDDPEHPDNHGVPLVVRTGYTDDPTKWADYGLVAKARDSIYVKNEESAINTAGNLLLISAESAAGDVRIETKGSIIDNNPNAITDTRTVDELAQLWDDLRLRGPLAEKKALENVEKYEEGKTASYLLYWQMRRRQADKGAAYDPNYAYTFTDAEKAGLLESGLTEGQIKAEAASRTAQYHQLHAQVGNLAGGRYVAGYYYEATDEEIASLNQGSSWTAAQLALSVSAGLLKQVTDTVTTIKEPNAKGKNVTLVADNNIGSYDKPLTIDLSEIKLEDLTKEQKAALAAAEAGDTSIDGNVITIVQPRAVNVTTGKGALTAEAKGGYAFIGSEKDLSINEVTAKGDVRIKTAGSLIKAAGSGAVNVKGDDLILEAANGGIGSVPDEDSGDVSSALGVEASAGSTVTARAANDIWINSTGDLLANTIFSREDARLDAAGSILDGQGGEDPAYPGNNILARRLYLNASGGGIGEAGNYLDVGVDSRGKIYAFADGAIYLNGPYGVSFTIGSVESKAGDIGLSSYGPMTVDGSVSGTGRISLSSGRLMKLTTAADIRSYLASISLAAGALVMEDDGIAAARIKADLSAIDIRTIGDALVTGIESGYEGSGGGYAVSIASLYGSILDAGDARLDILAQAGEASTVSLEAAYAIGGENPLDVKIANLESRSGGDVSIDEEDSINVIDAEAFGSFNLVAGASGSGSITGTSVTSLGGDLELTAADGEIVIDRIFGAQDLTATAGAGMDLGYVRVGRNLYLSGPKVIASVNGGPRTIRGMITGLNGSLASEVALSLAGSGTFAFENFWARKASVDVQGSGKLSIKNAIVKDRATFSNDQTLVLLNQRSKAIGKADIQLYSGGYPLSLLLSGNRLSTSASIIYRDENHEAISLSGASASALEEGERALSGASASGSSLGEEGGEETVTGADLVGFDGIPVTYDPGSAKGAAQ